MTAKIWLRVAGAIAFTQGLAHGSLILTYAPKHGASEVAVVEAMRTNFFRFGGPWAHSYWELYFGYALLAVFVCWLEGALLWMAQSWPDEVKRQVTWLLLGWNVVHAAVIARYFFFTPLYVDLMVIGCLGMALRKMRQSD